MMPPLVFASMTWFIGTAVVVWLDSRPRETFQNSHRAGGLIALVATAVIAFYGEDSSASAAYIAFAAAVAIWGWHEMGFLMGIVAGPRRPRVEAVSLGDGHCDPP
jgi:putative photosynthetic complex assembly protein 2